MGIESMSSAIERMAKYGTLQPLSGKEVLSRSSKVQSLAEHSHQAGVVSGEAETRPRGRQYSLCIKEWRPERCVLEAPRRHSGLYLPSTTWITTILRRDKH